MPMAIDNIPKAKKVACGSWHSLMIDENDKVWCWGRNKNGMLGDNSITDSNVPIQLEIENILDIGAGCFQSMAIDKDDNILVWGSNWNGQLGIGNSNMQLTPTISNINFRNELQIKEKHLDENKTVQGLFTASTKNKFSIFINHNKKFLVSLLLNILLFWQFLKLRKKVFVS